MRILKLIRAALLAVLLAADAAQAQTITYSGASTAASVALFGSGADGTVVIASGTTTLSRDMHYANLQLGGTGRIVTNGYTIYVSGTCDLSGAGAGAIQNNGAAGNAASGATAGAAMAGSNGWTVPSNRSGAAGAAGTSGAGAAGSQNGAQNFTYGGDTQATGVGGAGTNAGGASAGGTATTRPAVNIGGGPPQIFAQSGSSTNGSVWAGVSGYSGPSGGGDGTNSGGGGGGAAAGGGYVALRCGVIARGANATASIIQATGGIGGAGGTVSTGNVGGGAGGTGGGGGVIDIVAGSLTGSTIANALDVSGGAGGPGGNGAGTGKGGGGGGGGNGGATKVLVTGTGTLSLNTVNSTGSPGTAASGTTTGVAGSLGAISRSNL